MLDPRLTATDGPEVYCVTKFYGPGWERANFYDVKARVIAFLSMVRVRATSEPKGGHPRVWRLQMQIIPDKWVIFFFVDPLRDDRAQFHAVVRTVDEHISETMNN